MIVRAGATVPVVAPDAEQPACGLDGLLRSRSHRLAFLGEQFTDVFGEFFLEQVLQRIPVLGDVLIAEEDVQVAPPGLEGVADPESAVAVWKKVIVEN